MLRCTKQFDIMPMVISMLKSLLRVDRNQDCMDDAERNYGCFPDSKRSGRPTCLNRQRYSRQAMDQVVSKLIIHYPRTPVCASSEPSD